MLAHKLCGALTPLTSPLRPLTPRLTTYTFRSYSSDADKPASTKSGLFESMFGMASNTAGPSTNRWTMFVPAFCTHVCLGAPYGWSAISAQLTRENGIVASAASDWALDVASYPMSVMIAAGGISAALLGKWTIKVSILCSN